MSPDSGPRFDSTFGLDLGPEQAAWYRAQVERAWREGYERGRRDEKQETTNRAPR